jgi:hypothetical protein
MNLQADAMTRATQIATGALKTKWRDEGRKLSEFRISDHRKAIGEYLARHPEIVERASAEVAAWRNKGRRIRARRPCDFWALLTTARDAE